MRLNQIYGKYKDKINFFCIYIQEAHPEDGWQVDHNIDDDVIFNQPNNMDERAEIAQACMLRLELAMPTLLDDMQNTTDQAYVALPERLYVIDTDQRVIFQCGPGPFEFDVPAWEQAIKIIIE